MPFYAFEHCGDGHRELHVFDGPGALERRNAWVSERPCPGLMVIPGGRSFATHGQVEAHRGRLVYHRRAPQGESTLFTEV